MLHYIIKRILLILPTLLGIMIVNFVIIQFSPGGPVENMLHQIKSGHHNSNILDVESDIQQENNIVLDTELVQELKKLYGFDKIWYERLYDMIINYLHFDFGKSFYQDKLVLDIIVDKLPVSISLGLWTTIIIYSISIPLGIY